MLFTVFLMWFYHPQVRVSILVQEARLQVNIIVSLSLFTHCFHIFHFLLIVFIFSVRTTVRTSGGDAPHVVIFLCWSARTSCSFNRLQFEVDPAVSGKLCRHFDPIFSWRSCNPFFCATQIYDPVVIDQKNPLQIGLIIPVWPNFPTDWIHFLITLVQSFAARPEMKKFAHCQIRKHAKSTSHVSPLMIQTTLVAKHACHSVTCDKR